MGNALLTIFTPTYNRINELERLYSSLISQTDFRFEWLIVDDGSTDDTENMVISWLDTSPFPIRYIKQPNSGKHVAHNLGAAEASGENFICVDSDDWLDGAALSTMLSILRGFEERDQRVDLFISNYVYEKVYEGTHTAIGYKFALPRKKIFSWDQIGHFRPDQNLLMHSLCYRTDVLRESNLPMPAHTFYVDNIYAYVPLPRCKTMYYADIDLYRYFIGREGQSVNEATMVKRLGQQFRVTRIMMESFHLYQDVESSRLRSYMMGYFTMMMAICSVLTKLSEEDCADERLKTLWKDLKEYDERMYRRARYGVVGFFTNLRGRAGDKTTLGLYHLASKIFKFN